MKIPTFIEKSPYSHDGIPVVKGANGQEKIQLAFHIDLGRGLGATVTILPDNEWSAELLNQLNVEHGLKLLPRLFGSTGAIHHEDEPPLP